jgi:hypothetical protein
LALGSKEVDLRFRTLGDRFAELVTLDGDSLRVDALN